VPGRHGHRIPLFFQYTVTRGSEESLGAIAAANEIFVTKNFLKLKPTI
jgi:hypothetical protein